MRKYLPVLLVLAIIISVTSCDNKNEDKTTYESITPEISSELTTEAEEVSEFISESNMEVTEDTLTSEEFLNPDETAQVTASESVTPTPLPSVNSDEFWLYVEDEYETIFRGEDYMTALGYGVVDDFAYYFFEDKSIIRYDIEADIFSYIPAENSDEVKITYVKTYYLDSDEVFFLEFDCLSMKTSFESIEDFINAAEAFRHYKDDNWVIPSGYENFNDLGIKKSVTAARRDN